MSTPLFQVDAFTDELFKGNPAAVCILHEAASEEWMSQMAAEMNLSETAFVILCSTTSEKQSPNNALKLKWFTPTTEVSLCGHATLAAAKVLWQEGYCDPAQLIKFETLSGILTARQDGDTIELKFPLDVQRAGNVDVTADNGILLESLGLVSELVNYDQIEIIQGCHDYLIVIKNEKQLNEIKPDFLRLGTIRTRLIIVTAIADCHNSYDFATRVFVPSCGINEDPVTGSAYCLAGPYWAKKLDKTQLKAAQLSARGGVVEMIVKEKNILLRGKTKMVFKAKLYDHE